MGLGYRIQETGVTKDELMALPELESGFGEQQRIINGKVVITPVAPHDGVLWREESDPSPYVFDGQCWEVGMLDGRRVRRLLNSNAEEW